MPAVARLADQAQTSADAHGCPACPHPAIGPIVQGSADVFVNGRPAARKGDRGVHAVCCGPNTFTIAKGSPSVYVNGIPLARMNDKTQHCGGTGPITEGSNDVFADEGAGAVGLAKAALAALQIAVKEAKEVTVAARAARADDQFAWSPDVSSEVVDKQASAAGRDVYVLALQLDAIGGVPLAGETVEVIDAETGERVCELLQADEQGRIRAIVPKNKEYHVRIVDEVRSVPVEEHPHSLPTSLYILARFVDGTGKPLAREKLRVTADDASADIETNDHGEVQVAAEPSVHVFEIRGQKFYAHPVPLAEADAQAHYRFVVSTGQT
jgi:uncharacterized Zn-binding protein involved in type VI secretion